MPWQKEFNLSKHSKGCHLVTDEITAHTDEALKDVKVRFVCHYRGHIQFLILASTSDWHSVSFHVLSNSAALSFLAAVAHM